MPLALFRTTKASPELQHRRLQRARHVLATAQGDDIVLLDTRGERYFTLNEVGARIWTMLAEPTTLEQIVACIRREYDVGERDAIALDVTLLLRDLHSAGLLLAEPADGESR